MADPIAVQPGDFCCVPISGSTGRLIALGERLNGDAFTQYQHAEVFIGTEIPAHLGKMMPGLVWHGTPVTQLAPSEVITSEYGWVFSAYPGGARAVELPCPPLSLPGSLWSSGRIPLTEQQRAAILENCLALTGTPYSFLDYLALALHRLRIPAPGLRAFIAAQGHEICSQLCDRVYQEAGVHLFTDNRWPGYVTPADLAAVINSGGSGVRFDGPEPEPEKEPAPEPGERGSGGTASQEEQ